VRVVTATVAALIAFAALPAYALAAGTVAARSDTALDRFLAGLTTLRAEFTQTVRDARQRQVADVRGVLLVQRPGKFRWEVLPADGSSSAGQVLVADDRNLWFLDRDLEQVTVKPAASALTATPAALLSGAEDVRAAFRIDSAGRDSGLDWVRVSPLAADADFRDAMLGFSGNELRRMILNDKLGQVATISFTRMARNGPIKPAELVFTTPVGADVIGTPVP